MPEPDEGPSATVEVRVWTDADSDGFSRDIAYAGPFRHAVGDHEERLDVALKYMEELSRGKLNARLDVFNILDLDAETEVDEHADTASGQPSLTFGCPRAFSSRGCCA